VGFEDRCLFDVAFCHEMGSTQGDVVACSGGVVVSEVERGLLSEPSLLASLVCLFDG
jgi:hypothetical protein